MRCSVTTESGLKLKTTITQKDDPNTFSIRIKRPFQKMSDDSIPEKNRANSSEDSEVPSKRRKIDLRTRHPKIPEEPTRKKTTTVLAPYKAMPKPKPLETVSLGDIVLCKMRGYCEWPALVTGFDQKLVVIKFFGDQTSHKAAIHNFFSFKYSQDLIMHYLRTKKTPAFERAVKEAEIMMGIPDFNSIVNKKNEA